MGMNAPNKEMTMTNDYSKYYSAKQLKAKLLAIAGKLTQKTLRQILTLVALLKSGDVPVYAKAAIVAVLGYLIFPFDLFPDIFPGGLSDDFVAIALLFAEMAIYYNDEIDRTVDGMIKDIFGEGG